MAFKIEQGYHNWLPVQGYDAYALEIGAEFQQPTQTFLVIDRDYGKVLACPVFCGRSMSPLDVLEKFVAERLAAEGITPELKACRMWSSPASPFPAESTCRQGVTHDG